VEYATIAFTVCLIGAVLSAAVVLEMRWREGEREGRAEKK
jgi:hypothetical protein